MHGDLSTRTQLNSTENNAPGLPSRLSAVPRCIGSSRLSGESRRGKRQGTKRVDGGRRFQDVGVLAYNHCSKFQGMDPKPDVFATCRKYHRAGTKQGFRLGIDAMKSVLDEEWEGLKGMKSEP
eukprot:g2979.t1 g2979   contig12:1192617-1192985(+)